MYLNVSCVIRISKILLYAIHNEFEKRILDIRLCYQDFKDTFVCNTQLLLARLLTEQRCVIRISKILLYAIHNQWYYLSTQTRVVLSGFQRYFCMQYTTKYDALIREDSCVIRISKILLYAIHNCAPRFTLRSVLCYQDFKDTFVCNTQHDTRCCFRSNVVLSGFQRYFCMQYTT